MSKSKNTPKDSSAPAWVWLLTGVLIGLFLAFLYYLNQISPLGETPQGAYQAAPATQTTPPANPANPEAARQDRRPNYDFYTKFATETLQQNTPQPQPLHPRFKSKTVIQSGAFTQPKDADRRRAQIMLLGLPVAVEVAQVGANQRFHRVIVGPFNSQQQLATARTLLDDNGIEHMVRTVKP